MSGHQPDDTGLRQRWQNTAREIAGHRIDHHITSQDIALDPGAADHAILRSITDTRAALGLESTAAGHDAGREI